MHPHGGLGAGVHPHQHVAVESLISTPTFSAGDYDDHQGHGPVGAGGMMGMNMMGMGASGSPGKARIRRSENELRQAAECVVKGSTFQTVSDRFGIPISTIRFYMARRGILPQRRRGRSSSSTAMMNPFHQIP
ncbi:hypothetical protein ONE63_004068 [Megalurothrips usitatus]|uniref:HTH psq-type domain-containing protein n=1 Tax=Megalurothrips usitatus TaxID=439358 RepID=A0AAV7X835_9NEOP|nr:hypothetical protein ONE63_004068 [Megalurothrips usitatus]